MKTTVNKWEVERMFEDANVDSEKGFEYLNGLELIMGMWNVEDVNRFINR